jgi:RHS repeat-associated protein
MPVEESVTTSGNPTLTQNFLGARGLEAMTTKVGNNTPITSYPLYDVHGNMVGTVQKGSSGTSWTIHDERSYDVWGSVRSGASSGGPRGRYCANLGHVQDDESGLIYMRARYYEPGSGRFVNEDPARQDSNWYSYCGSDPINYADKTGQIKFTINGYTFRLDFDHYEFGDLHVFNERGKELAAVTGDGFAKHPGTSAGELTDDMIRSVIRAAKSDMNARAILSLINQGYFGVSAERLGKLIKNGAKALGVIGAISSLDAYMRFDPLDFIDTLAIIGMSSGG